MGLIKFILKKALPVPKFKDCKSFAFVGPHPDDIEVGCGATVAEFVHQGKRVCFIVATDGRYGSLDINTDKEELVKTRKAEAIAAAKRLGVEDVRFLGFPDGGGYDLMELKDKIAVELAKFKPDIVFVPDNHLKSEVHPDHINTGRAGEIALLTSALPLMMKDLGVSEAALPKGIAYYYTDKPNTFVNVSKTFNDKIEALKLHKSQFLYDAEAEKTFKFLVLYFKITAVRYGLRRLCKYADGYRVLATMHLHCAPEASDF